MWQMFGPSAPAPTAADKMGAAITKLDAILLSHSEMSEMQQSMAAAHRERAVAELAAGCKPAAIRAGRKAMACDRQVTHIEEIIASTTQQQQALQLSAIHASSIAGVAEASVALQSAPDADEVSAQLEIAADMLAAVEETQDLYATMATTGSASNDVTDDELLESLQNTSPAAPTPPVSRKLPPLPEVPSADPVRQQLHLGLEALVDFA